MPQPPEGEQELRDLALRFTRAEGVILALLGFAASGDRVRSITQALEALAALRRLDYRSPVVAAYLHQHPKGRPDAVRDLAGSLARRLDTGAQVAADSVRTSFKQVIPDTIDEHVTAAVTAAVDRAGNRWTLGSWAAMQTTTIGRQASSRGVVDAVGDGGVVHVDVGECALCAELFSGDLIVGQDALPPGHPGCTCVVSR